MNTGDERFSIHRLKATRLAAIAGAAVAGGWYLFYFWTRHELHQDLLSVLLVMIVVKFATIAYYRTTN